MRRNDAAQAPSVSGKKPSLGIPQVFENPTVRPITKAAPSNSTASALNPRGFGSKPGSALAEKVSQVQI
jgi:hypothetical protein